MPRFTKRATALLAAATLSVVSLTACTGKATEPFKDAPRGTTNSGPADTITMPDGFSNVAAKCDGPNRVYVVFHGDSPYGDIAVVPNDPRCH